MGISPVTLGATPVFAAPPVTPAAATPDDSDTSGWLSGMGDLFAGVGTAISSGLRAANAPNVQPGSGFVFNPSTGQYYNPVTGQALTATGNLTSAGALPGLFGGNNSLLIIALALLAFMFFRKRE